MENKALMTKLRAWMSLHSYNDDADNPIKCHKNKEGLYVLKVDIPLINKTITITHEDKEHAKEVLLIEFSKEVDEFIKDSLPLRVELDERMKKMELAESRHENLEDFYHKKRSEEEQFDIDIMTHQLNKVLEESIDATRNLADDVALILDEDPSRVYIKVLPRNFFGENLKDKEVEVRAHLLMRVDLRQAKYVPVFSKCRVNDNFVISIAIIDKMK